MDKLQLDIGGYSTPGTRDENQDAFAVYYPQDQQLSLKGAVAVIADGASGSSKACQAAQLCTCNFIWNYVDTPATWTVKSSAKKVIQGLNRWCYGQHDYADSGQSQLVTTLSALILKKSSGFIFHTGDTRIYRLQNGLFEQLTLDHARRLGHRKILTRAIGVEPNIELDFTQLTLRQDDLFILSTQGVHHYLSDKQLQDKLSDWQNHPFISLEQLAKNIVHAALNAGGDDNASCLIVKIKKTPLETLDDYVQHSHWLALPPELKAGDCLEEHRVLEVLVSNDECRVYKVMHEKSGKILALKAPLALRTRDKSYLSGFLQEEWLGQQFSHPHLLRVFSRAENSKFMYQILEYVDAQTLEQWMAQHPKPSILQVRNIFVQLVKGLRVLQRHDMVHRGLRPQNILVCTNGEVKLTGLADVQLNALTETHTPVTTTFLAEFYCYMAPESCLYQQFDYRSDLFALAVVVYQMLSGQLPFALDFNSSGGLTPEDWQYTSLYKYRPDLPHWLDLALEKALNVHPLQRYQAFSEFVFDLSQPNPSLLVRQEPQPLMKRNPLLIYRIICGLLLCLIAVLLAS